jgi:hypothetical protein
MSALHRTIGKPYTCIGLLCLILLCVATPSALAAGRPAKKPKVQKVSLLYALSAASGTLKPAEGKGADYKLTLKNLDRNVTWFSDRPARSSGSLPVSGLAKAWEGFGFLADPPNAALTYTDRSGRRGRTVILELSRPHFAKGRLSFTARAIDPGSVKSPNLRAHAAVADRSPAHRFIDASLFLDDTEAPVVDGCYVVAYAGCFGVSFKEVDLSGLNLEKFNLEQGSFTKVNLAKTNLSGASFRQVEFLESNLTEATLAGADLEYVKVVKSTLVRANLQQAHIPETEFIENNLEYADLFEASIYNPYNPPEIELQFQHQNNICYMRWYDGQIIEPPCTVPGTLTAAR